MDKKLRIMFWVCLILTIISITFVNAAKAEELFNESYLFSGGGSLNNWNARGVDNASTASSGIKIEQLFINFDEIKRLDEVKVYGLYQGLAADRSLELNATTTYAKYTPVTAYVDGNLYAHGVIGWEKYVSGSNNFYFVIQFSDFSDIAESITGKKYVNLSYNTSIYTTYINPSVTSSQGHSVDMAGFHYADIVISAFCFCGGLNKWEYFHIGTIASTPALNYMISYSYEKEATVSLNKVTGSYGLVNITKNSYNFTSKVLNSSGYWYFNRSDVLSSSDLLPLSDKLILNLGEPLSGDWVNKTIYEPPAGACIPHYYWATSESGTVAIVNASYGDNVWLHSQICPYMLTVNAYDLVVLKPDGNTAEVIHQYIPSLNQSILLVSPNYDQYGTYVSAQKTTNLTEHTEEILAWANLTIKPGANNTPTLAFNKSNYTYPIPDKRFNITYNIPGFQNTSTYIVRLTSPDGKEYSYVLSTASGNRLIDIPEDNALKGQWAARIAAQIPPYEVYQNLSNYAYTQLYLTQYDYELWWSSNDPDYHVVDFYKDEPTVINVVVPPGHTVYFNVNKEAYFWTLEANGSYPYNLTTDLGLTRPGTYIAYVTADLDGNIILNSSAMILHPEYNQTDANTTGKVSVKWGDISHAEHNKLSYSNPSKNSSTLTVVRPDGSTFTGYPKTVVTNMSSFTFIEFDQSGYWTATITDNGNASNTDSDYTTFWLTPLTNTKDDYFIWTTEEDFNAIQNDGLIREKGFYYQGDHYLLAWKFNKTLNLSVISSLILMIEDKDGNNIIMPIDLNYSLQQIQNETVVGIYADHFKPNSSIGIYTAKIKITGLKEGQPVLPVTQNWLNSAICSFTNWISPTYGSSTCDFLVGQPNVSIPYEDFRVAYTALVPTVNQIYGYKLDIYGDQLQTKTFEQDQNIYIKFTSRETIKLYMFYDADDTQVKFTCEGTGTMQSCSVLKLNRIGTYRIEMRESLDSPILQTYYFKVVPLSTTTWSPKSEGIDTTCAFWEDWVLTIFPTQGVNDITRFQFALLVIGGLMIPTAVLTKNFGIGVIFGFFPYAFFLFLSLSSPCGQFMPLWTSVFVALIIGIKLRFFT